MNLLLLAGNSIRNRDWIQQVAVEMQQLVGTTTVHQYSHWETGTDVIDLEHELERLTLETKSAAPYGIFAKSVGSVLAIKAIEQGLLQPSFLLFTGVPVGYIQEAYPKFTEVVAKADLPMTIVQNNSDPAGSYANVQGYLDPESRRITFVETPGDTHSYDDYDLIRQELSRLINATS